MKFHPEI